MRIWKRISFSLEGSLGWVVSFVEVPKEHQRGFFFSRCFISLGFKSGASVLPESAKTCQYYFAGFSVAGLAAYRSSVHERRIKFSQQTPFSV